ncbi:META domain-containing protein [Aquimarina aggregata]|uniref:META domain-containing protein n=1 Tax=Aquimarina aggregata TaxID=1642818 RepID=UPI002491A6F9|nr:META domain-containing protein [Aquimarina aggregata]
MKHLFIILLFFTFSNTKNCNNKKTTDIHKDQTIQETIPSKFYIITLNGKDISEEKLHITFNKKSNSTYGFSGCNTFSCSYTDNKEIVSFESPISTKMYCEKKIKLEDSFLKSIIQSKSKHIKQDSLFLRDKNKKVLISGIRAKEE